MIFLFDRTIKHILYTAIAVNFTPHKTEITYKHCDNKEKGTRKFIRDGMGSGYTPLIGWLCVFDMNKCMTNDFAMGQKGTLNHYQETGRDFALKYDEFQRPENVKRQPENVKRQP